MEKSGLHNARSLRHCVQSPDKYSHCCNTRVPIKRPRTTVYNARPLHCIVTWELETGGDAHFYVTANAPRLLVHRLPPTAVRMNHERLPRHCVDRATSSMTSRYKIYHILTGPAGVGLISSGLCMRWRRERASRSPDFFRMGTCGSACLYSLAKNTKISPQICITFEEIFQCLLQHLHCDSGEKGRAHRLIPLQQSFCWRKFYGVHGLQVERLAHLPSISTQQ
jgi:hypothetical protein